MAQVTPIDAKDFTLNKWLKLLLNNRESVTPNTYFPNETARDEYLQKVKNIPERNVKDLLRILLPRTGYSESDIITFNAIIKAGGEKKAKKFIESSERWKKVAMGRSDIWEGISWILDLLPHNPREALQTLENYFLANMWHFSDAQIWSHSDCVDIITAKYYDPKHPQSLFLNSDPKEFEYLIEELYKKKGYTTKVIGNPYDQGIDIVAYKEDIGEKEKVLIQCKRTKKTIGCRYVRELHGAVTDKKATKGVLVATSEFSKAAVKLAEENPRLELIGYSNLTHLLNRYLGTKWPRIMKSLYRNKRIDTKEN